MDEWLKEFACWTTEEEELQARLHQLKEKLEAISPFISSISVEEAKRPSYPTQIVYIARRS